ncbi:hypothetical protein L596_010264 [Steinernema carpocapsae]|uniref:RRM domain-containing protein n=1 Tax=Steinernema carpocapsae TaxID=34508 RepID=A0A4U5PIJ6_STECR|nr:hypothetical protein L596_010264 [Steinernema carpocapsae]
MLTGGTIQNQQVVLKRSSKEEMEHVLAQAYRGFSHANNRGGMPLQQGGRGLPNPQQQNQYEQDRRGPPARPENHGSRGDPRWNDRPRNLQGQQAYQNHGALREDGPPRVRVPGMQYEGSYGRDERPPLVGSQEPKEPEEYDPYYSAPAPHRGNPNQPASPPRYRPERPSEYPENDYQSQSWKRYEGGQEGRERLPSREDPRASYDLSRNGPALDSRPQAAPLSCIEMTNLPSDLLRPAALEDYIRPMTPLTLSSVKMVLDPATRSTTALVRFPNPTDAHNAMRLNGTRGIAIRSISVGEFEKAEETIPGVPVAAPMPAPVAAPVPIRFRSPPGRPQEDTWRNGPGGPVGKGRSPPYGGERGRSPSRRGRFGGNSRWDGRRQDHRSRSRSPIRRRENRPPNSPPQGIPADQRFDVVLQNVPFKVTIAQWEDFAAHNGVKYRSITRTYYEDGNASDRWIMGFTCREDAEKLLAGHKSPLGSMGGRQLKMAPISAIDADQLMAIPDKFGELKKEEYDRQRGRTEEEMIREGELPPTAFGAFSVTVPVSMPKPPKPSLLGGPGPAGRAPGGSGLLAKPTVSPVDPTDERAAAEIRRLIDGPPTDMQMKIMKQLLMSGVTPTKADLEMAATLPQGMGDSNGYPRGGPPHGRHVNGPRAGGRPQEMNGYQSRQHPMFFHPNGPRPSRFGPRNY